MIHSILQNELYTIPNTKGMYIGYITEVKDAGITIDFGFKESIEYKFPKNYLKYKDKSYLQRLIGKSQLFFKTNDKITPIYLHNIDENIICNVYIPMDFTLSYIPDYNIKYNQQYHNEYNDEIFSMLDQFLTLEIDKYDQDIHFNVWEAFWAKLIALRYLLKTVPYSEIKKIEEIKYDFYNLYSDVYFYCCYIIKYYYNEHN